MSESASLEHRIATLFLEKLHLEIPSIETDLFESGLIDSMAFVDLLLHLEQEFGVRVPFDDVDIDHFRSIQAIARFVTKRKGAKASPEART